jgi:hypothetical protein
MTETDARKKWCPIMSARTMSGGDFVKCQGSECALWTPIPKYSMDDLPNKGRCGLAHPVK